MSNVATTGENQASPSNRRMRRYTGVFAAAAIAGGLALTGCGGSSGPTAPSTAAPAAGSSAGGGPILPVTSDPIANPATAETLTIDSVLVENNVDASGSAVDDHLEIALSNTGTTDLGGFEVYTTFSDPTDNITESYYTELPDSFTIPAGDTRIAHFDNTGAPDHFPVNDFSLSKTSANALEVTVEVSAIDAAVQTATVMKDAGGEEIAD